MIHIHTNTHAREPHAVGLRFSALVSVFDFTILSYTIVLYTLYISQNVI